MANTPKPVRAYRKANAAAGKAAGTKKEVSSLGKAAKAEDKVYKTAPRPSTKMGGAKPAPKSSGPKSKGAY
jgi:hypothetical protein